MKLKDYIEQQLALGKCYFTMMNVCKDLNVSPNVARSAIARLAARGEITSPASGFYVIIAPEYRVLGCLPPEYFVPYLMHYLGHEHYYVGLITAASFYGAAHQASQIFQVITAKKYPSSITCGRVRIKLIRNINAATIPTKQFSTPYSRITVSTAEATAIDLVRFIKQSGGLNHIATLLAELKDVMKPGKLRMLVETQEGLAWKQRLGYILESVEAPKLANVIKKFLEKQSRVPYIPLSPGLRMEQVQKRNEIWKIIENTAIESDL